MNVTGLDNLYKIVVMNPKGGCGKTTLATNMASSYAQHGPPPTLVDCDPQGFSLRWLEQRPANRPPIHGLAAYQSAKPLAARVEPDSRALIFDLPAAIAAEQLHHYTYFADTILIPVMPSAVDVHSATRLIAELLLDQQLDRREGKLAIVANRVKRSTKSYQMLRRFLSSLRIPLIATLRDSQNFVYAIGQGIGVCELPAYRALDDIQQLQAIRAWLHKSRPRRRRSLSEHDRQTLIAELAYRHAQERGFQGGDPTADWVEAERQVDALYSVGGARS